MIYPPLIMNRYILSTILFLGLGVVMLGKKRPKHTASEKKATQPADELTT